MNDVKPNTFWKFGNSNLIVMAIEPKSEPCSKVCSRCTGRGWKGMVVSEDKVFSTYTIFKVVPDFCLGADDRFQREDFNESKDNTDNTG